ncbi:MAG TPA: iron-sulfur cluster biosynthesis family protein [Usitatibacteraceae bacterium]|jgi:iron-sulfur cluster assembly protein|nr:iron-sulfur cluster biosynthesis family protein [Usitatibacteraceae bacterium]HQY45745.1 iron-sulfur cluster biosynthesis family protein [Usitatibacteraceae bacterium]HRA24318.1 iron-sulfur cluster biosynthesis family protein [Usitatibacteraceae bacterium]
MITITQAAAERIRQSAADAGVAPPVLRVAAKQGAGGAVDFGMGFDQSRPGDTLADIEGIQVVVAAPSRELVEGVTLDFVELEPGDFRFIFARPGEGGPP